MLFSGDFMEFNIGDKIKYIVDDSIYIIDVIENNYAYGHNEKYRNIKCCIRNNYELDYNNFIIYNHKLNIYKDGFFFETIIKYDKPKWKFLKKITSSGTSGT